MTLVPRIAAALALILSPMMAADDPNRQLARDIFQQLIEINTTDSVGSTTTAANAMARRLLDAGFPAQDVQVLGPNDRRGNLVARYRGTGAARPLLIICHLDVVEALRSDWTTDPFQFIEKDGYFYGRGTQDMKDSDAAMVANFIRLRREGWHPNRDLILALTAGEESGRSNGVSWLLQNHRDLVDAAFALNPDSGGVTSMKGKIVNVDVEASEKMYADFELSATNPGGHSSLPTPITPSIAWPMRSDAWKKTSFRWN
jgi:acetylornithine deacetylase/succinyl-diaminopimelate desuccinylase-like protein